MSFLSSKLIRAARSNSSGMCKAFLHRTGIQRNYWRHRDPFSELSGVMRSVENYMNQIDREMNRVFGDVKRASPVTLPKLFAPFEWSRSRDVPVVSTDGDRRLYKLELDMEGMKPEDINIILKNNELTVTARQEEKRDDGSRFFRENTYHYSLPAEVNPDTIRSTLSEGVLTIEAQLPALESKEIPIKIENAEKPASTQGIDQNK